MYAVYIYIAEKKNCSQNRYIANKRNPVSLSMSLSKSIMYPWHISGTWATVWIGLVFPSTDVHGRRLVESSLINRLPNFEINGVFSLADSHLTSHILRLLPPNPNHSTLWPDLTCLSLQSLVYSCLCFWSPVLNLPFLYQVASPLPSYITFSRHLYCI